MVGNILPSWVDACQRLLRLSIVGLFWSDLDAKCRGASCAGCRKSPQNQKFASSRSMSVEKIFTSHTVRPATSHQPPAASATKVSLWLDQRAETFQNSRPPPHTPVSASVAAGSATAASDFAPVARPESRTPEPRSQNPDLHW